MRRLLASRLSIGLASLVVGGLIIGAVWALSAGDDAGGGDGRVRISYEPGSGKSADLIRRSRVLDRAVRTVNREIDLPQDLSVRVIGDASAARLGVSGPVYEPRERTVYYPWAFVTESHGDLRRLSRRSPAELDELVNLRRLDSKALDRLLEDSMVFVLYHEVSHGLFDVLDIPVVGGEEPTADSLAAIFAIASLTGGQAVTLAGAALEVARGDQKGEPTLADYADDHGFDRQRAFNSLCLVYGSSPSRNRNLVGGPGDLTPSRSRLCPFEYRGDLRSWRRLLRDRLTDRGGLLPLKE